jgi:hypothetical protein
MQVRRDERRAVLGAGSEDLADAALARPRETLTWCQPEPPRPAPPVPEGVEGDDSVLGDAQRIADEQGVPLADESRAEEARVDGGDPTPELRRNLGAGGNVTDAPHPAPPPDASERPDRQLLQADDVRAIRAREPDHLLEEGAALRRTRVAVEEVPSPNKQAH